METNASLPFQNSLTLVHILSQINPLLTSPLFQYHLSISMSFKLSLPWKWSNRNVVCISIFRHWCNTSVISPKMLS